MSFQITLSGSLAEINSAAHAIAAMTAPAASAGRSLKAFNSKNDVSDEETPAPKRRGRRTNAEIEAAKKAAEAEEDDQSDAEDEEAEEEEPEEVEGEDEEENEIEDEEEEKPAKKTAAKGAPDLKQVLSAFKDYAAENGRPKAAKILAKFSKDKNVHSIPKAKYAEVLKALRA